MTALQAGQLLEGTVYQVVREIGAGGMGVVYEVEHVRLKKRYVAKIMHEQVRGEDGAQKRMEREAHVLAEINHPNIVQVHDVGTTPDGTSYFVMEKLEGMDLRTAIKRGGIGRGRALSIVVDILDALAHVHQRGIVHRDIKPENVFLARQHAGTLTKVLDFGVVHIFDGDGHSSRDRITKTGGFIGTLYYAAPEQMQGQPASPPNDVYASALVLFELLAGRGPFDDDPGVGLSRCFKPAPRLDVIVPTAGKELADIVADALAQDPAKRPDAPAFAGRLRTILAGEPTTPEQASVDAEVDDLLQNMALQSRAVSATGFAPTASPLTPLMAGAPSRISSVAIAPTMAAPSPLAIAPTAFSASTAPTTPPAFSTAVSAQTVPPRVDTSPGLYQTVSPAITNPGIPAPRSAFSVVSSIIAVVVVLGIAGAGGTWLLKRNTDKPTTVTAASVAPAPAPIPAPTPIVEPTAATATAEPAAAPTASAEPPPPVKKPTAPVATVDPAAAKPAPQPTAPKPAPAASSRAKKEGYIDNL